MADNKKKIDYNADPKDYLDKNGNDTRFGSYGKSRWFPDPLYIRMLKKTGDWFKMNKKEQFTALDDCDDLIIDKIDYNADPSEFLDEHGVDLRFVRSLFNSPYTIDPPEIIEMKKDGYWTTITPRMRAWHYCDCMDRTIDPKVMKDFCDSVKNIRKIVDQEFKEKYGDNPPKKFKIS